MTRPHRFEHYRWLGDKRTMVVHDTDNSAEGCALDDLLRSEAFTCFAPDILAEARNRGYRPCRHCAGGGRLRLGPV